MRIAKRHPVLKIVNQFFIDSPLPANISYLYNFGSLLGLILIIQIVTGLLLSMHYCANVLMAFNSVEHIMRDVNYGWLLRYLHSNGASFFFILIYIHIGRGLYYGSYNQPRQLLWSIGVIIYVAVMATAFTGYCIVYGQMSYWGAVVITNFFSAIPYLGNDLVQLIWGNYSVGNATLNRFFSVHFILPFVVAALALLHMLALHENGSTNPLGHNSQIDTVPFHHYFTIKDLFGVGVFLIFYLYFVFYMPNYLGHSDNYIMANPLVTPAHIVPEWYFLPLYGILRSIPSKLGGVIMMFSSMFILLLLPYLHISPIRSSTFRPIYRVAFWYFIGIVYLLLMIGGKPVEYPYVTLGQIATTSYFVYFLIVIPTLGILDRVLVINKIK